MPQINSNRSKPATAVLVVLLASLVLAACGGSSTNSSSSTSASASATTSTTGGIAGALKSRFTALRECLQKNGITLPKRTPGQVRPPGAGGFLGGGAGPLLQKGITPAQYQAALKKCGGGLRAGGFAGRFNNPAFKAALTKFAACMRENGVNVPQPNTSGNGPIFNSAGLSTSSAKFQAAEAKCRSDLPGAFARPGIAGAPGTAGGAGVPPATAG